ncbi:MAG: hypothetical protein KAH32_05795 [Chlamydiia bacterium]|nr:hypothetical protein [Chlamydiia bacterium]
MDELELYVYENELTPNNILKLIDDYSIYSHYIGAELEIGTKYSSPLREGDDDPSFALYFSKKYEDTIMFKDHALGKFGRVFTFLRLIYGASLHDVLAKVNADFNLGLNNAEKVPELDRVVYKKMRPVKEVKEIRITSQAPTPAFIAFFDELGIGKAIIDEYEAYCVKLIHFIVDGKTSIIKPRTLSIAYLIDIYYKIYQPFDSKYYKFRNNYPYGFVEGAFQLKYVNDFIIITKSSKECMFFRQHWDYDSVAGTSETVIISDYFVENVIRPNYKHVLIWLDNDPAGIKAMAKYQLKYPDFVPVFTNGYKQKDPTDIYKAADSKPEVLIDLDLLIHNSLRICRKNEEIPSQEKPMKKIS